MALHPLLLSKAAPFGALFTTGVVVVDLKEERLKSRAITVVEVKLARLSGRWSEVTLNNPVLLLSFHLSPQMEHIWYKTLTFAFEILYFYASFPSTLGLSVLDSLTDHRGCSCANRSFGPSAFFRAVSL